MSWLLVAFIPGLLMLATFGLQRLESGLAQDTLSATDVDEFLQQAEASDVDTLARDGMDRALDSLHRRLHDRSCKAGGFVSAGEASGLPIRLHTHRGPNPEFQPTRHANRV